MKKLITTLLRHWVKTPVKISLTLLSVALGTAILIISFSAGSIIEDEIVSLMNKDGLILHVSNGEWGTDGKMDQQRPTDWKKDITERFLSDSSIIKEVATIFKFPIPNLSSNGKTYQIRTIMGSDPSYLDIFSLNIISGVPMTDLDFNKGLQKIWLSEDTANIMFGNAEDAIGQKVSPPGRQRSGKQAQFLISQFTVSGVYENPTEVARRAYGIADVVFPITAVLPTDKKGANVLDWLSGNLVIKSTGTSIEKTTSEINQIVEVNYGTDTQVTIWEGDPDGLSNYMNELRQTISIFTVSINILGIVLLLTSSLGIFSIMVVEALGRKREIAIERSLGASRLRIISEFWQWSVMLSLIGAILGVLLAFLLEGPVLGTMSPLLMELTDVNNLGLSIKPLSLISGVALALGCGGILGVLPAFSAVRGDISDTLREA